MLKKRELKFQLSHSKKFSFELFFHFLQSFHTLRTSNIAHSTRSVRAPSIHTHNFDENDEWK
jgi:hypothetical protein